MAIPLLRFMLCPQTLKRMIHTLRYPSQISDDLPPAEILSISVSENARGEGVGKTLMEAALTELANRGLSAVKVAVWSGNTTANNFYLKCGFSLAHTREHHGLPMNIYVAQTKRAVTSP